MKKQNNMTDKLTDKMFSRLALTSVLGIFVCIICLCSTTFAWFSDSAPSNNNEIKMAGECKLTVTLSGGEVLEKIEGAEDQFETELPAGEYTVTLSLPADSASGYCVISTDNATYNTEYIARHSEAVEQTVSLTLTVETPQTVKLTRRWGIYADDSNTVSGSLTLS